MAGPITWVSDTVVFALHDRQIAEHGGADGVRDAGLISSALARPKNLSGYEAADIAARTASYAFGLARNHGFVDGNKRTAWVVVRLFLRLNGATLVFDAVEAVALMRDVAAGGTGEAQLAAWFRARMAGSDTAK